MYKKIKLIFIQILRIYLIDLYIRSLILFFQEMKLLFYKKIDV